MIRLIDRSELTDAAALGPVFWKESGLTGTFDQETFIKSWHGIMASGRGFVLALFHGPIPVGYLGMVIGKDINDGVMVANELFWFVHQDHRGEGVKLLIKAEQLAKEKGCKRMTMVHLIDQSGEKLSHIYTKMDFRPIELHYLKDL